MPNNVPETPYTPPVPPTNPAPFRGAVAIETHGCKLNQADSNVLARQFVEAGYRLVDSVAEADVYVLNTCTVTATADAKARQALNAARRSNPRATIVAAGCYPQRAAEELARLESVSLVVPNTHKHHLVSLVTAAREGRSQSKIDYSAFPFFSGAPVTDENGQSVGGERFGGVYPEPSRRAQDRLIEPRPSTSSGRTELLAQRESSEQNASGQSVTFLQDGFPFGRSRAMVKIQEGCDQVCAYCIVPKVRGRERSISPEDLVRQINQLVDEGYREVVLTGTQLGTYGFDIPGASLSGLLGRILNETSVPRLRVSSLQPQEISPELLELWADTRLCPHFHIPLQSGSDSVLKAMRRRYDTETFAGVVETVRSIITDAGVTADLIVGFPGEGESEFQESRAFVQSMSFSDLHIFPYSPRPGTSAAYFKDQLPAAVKKERVAEMIALARRDFQTFRAGQLGMTRPVLWESSREHHWATVWSGLTDNYIRVYTDSKRPLRNVISMATLSSLEDDGVYAQALPI